MKRCLTLMQFKITQRYSFSCNRLEKVWQHILLVKLYWEEYRMVHSYRENVEQLSNLHMHSPSQHSLHWQSIKWCMNISFIAALFVVAKDWNQPKWSQVGDWLRELWYFYTKERAIRGKNKKGVRKGSIYFSEAFFIIYC